MLDYILDEPEQAFNVDTALEDISDEVRGTKRLGDIRKLYETGKRLEALQAESEVQRWANEILLSDSEWFHGLGLYQVMDALHSVLEED